VQRKTASVHVFIFSLNDVPMSLDLFKGAGVTMQPQSKTKTKKNSKGFDEIDQTFSIINRIISAECF
jgi:hypothetical protein